jgi:hypothetical protein
MAEYRINSQNDTIEKVLLAFKELMIGEGIAARCNIETISAENSSTIVIKTKDEKKEIKPEDLFWFGYFIGRDFEDCPICTERRQLAIDKLNTIVKKRKNNNTDEQNLK